jgi:uncharacterized protein
MSHRRNERSGKRDREPLDPCARAATGTRSLRRAGASASNDRTDLPRQPRRTLLTVEPEVRRSILAPASLARLRVALVRPGAGVKEMMTMTTMRSRAAAVILVAIVMTGCGDAETNEPTPGVANPASEYCVEQGGMIEIREDAQGDQYGVCIFDDGSECDEWELYRGECQPDQQS